MELTFRQYILLLSALTVFYDEVAKTDNSEMKQELMELARSKVESQFARSIRYVDALGVRNVARAVNESLHLGSLSLVTSTVLGSKRWMHVIVLASTLLACLLVQLWLFWSKSENLLRSDAHRPWLLTGPADAVSRLLGLTAHC